MSSRSSHFPTGRITEQDTFQYNDSHESGQGGEHHEEQEEPNGDGRHSDKHQRGEAHKRMPVQALARRRLQKGDHLQAEKKGPGSNTASARRVDGAARAAGRLTRGRKAGRLLRETSTRRQSAQDASHPGDALRRRWTDGKSEGPSQPRVW